MVETITPQRSKISLWMQAIRPFSFSASVTPIILSAMIVLAYYEGYVYWFLLPAILLGGLFFHISTNLISEYFDYKKTVDRKDTFGSSRVVVDGLLAPREVLFGGLIALAVGFLIGLTLVYYHGLPILIMGLIGVIGVYFYTAGPISFKYIALGDLAVFVMFGPLLVIGSYYGLTGTYSANALLISIPIGFLVVAILHANNTRDILHDSQANIKTIAMLIGIKGSIIEYYLLVLGAYVFVAVLVILKILAPWALIVFLSLPPAISNLKSILRADVNKPEEIAMLDVKTAQHHMLFGLILSIGILLTALFK